MAAGAFLAGAFLAPAVSFFALAAVVAARACSKVHMQRKRGKLEDISFFNSDKLISTPLWCEKEALTLVRLVVGAAFFLSSEAAAVFLAGAEEADFLAVAALGALFC